MSSPKQLNNFVNTLLNIDSAGDMKKFLKVVLTPEEYRLMPVRLEIIKLLEKGVSQREIVNKLGVGIATVTRGSRELKSNHSWWKDFSAWRVNN